MRAFVHPKSHFCAPFFSFSVFPSRPQRLWRHAPSHGRRHLWRPPLASRGRASRVARRSPLTINVMRLAPTQCSWLVVNVHRRCSSGTPVCLLHVSLVHALEMCSQLPPLLFFKTTPPRCASFCRLCESVGQTLLVCVTQNGCDQPIHPLR